MSEYDGCVCLDTTPAGLSDLADHLDAAADYAAAGFTLGTPEVSKVMRQAVTVLRALATPSPPAPQERELDSCRWFAERPHPEKYGMVQVSWFATKAEAEHQLVEWGAGRIWENPRYYELSAPAVPDHAGLLTRLEAAGPMIVKCGRATYIEIDEADYHAILAALRPTGGETHA